jgi:hypothetical protein
MGVSRSPTALLLLLLLMYGHERAADAFTGMVQSLSKPWPNVNMIRAAEELLGLDGRLIPQLHGYRERNPGLLSAYRRLNKMRQGRYADKINQVSNAIRDN